VRKPGGRKAKDMAAMGFLYGAAGLVVFLLAGIIGYILRRGVPYLSPELLLEKPSFLRDTVGILPNILNTLYIVLMTLLLVVPLGVGAAVYLQEYAKPGKRTALITFATETLAGIPSIVYGLAGMLLFVRVLGLGTSLLAGALTLTIMTLPTIIRTTQESLKTVPHSMREGALSLGAGKWYMIRTVVLPGAIQGIVTGCILAVGRIVGESAALLFTAGMANEMIGFWEAARPQNAGATLTVALYMYAKERGEFDIAFAIAVLLIAVTLLINLFASKVGGRGKRERKRK